MAKKTLDQLQARRREVNGLLGELDNTIQSRELNDEEKKQQASLLAEYESLNREIQVAKSDMEIANMSKSGEKDDNASLREFILGANKGRAYSLSMRSISYGQQTSGSTVTYPGTDGYVQGITVVDLIDTTRKDGDILVTAGVPMTTGVTGNKIQWAFAGGVEAAFANELAATTERDIDLDKQVPVQQRLTVRVRISNQALENTDFDLRGYIVQHVSDAIRDKVNAAAASTTQATSIFYGPFAQADESGTYGASGYTAGKQSGTYSSFSKETAAEMIAKLATRKLKTDKCVFVMGAADYWALKVTPFDEGSGIMLIGNDDRLLGIPVVVNEHINDATISGSTAGHNIGFGNFKYLPVMQHGNVRLTVDSSSATVSSTDETYVTINADFSMTILKDGADAFVLYSKAS